MSKEEALKQLYDLLDDRRSFITDDKEISEVYEDDIKAIEYLIKENETNEICLQGYRASILRQCSEKKNVDYIEDFIKENYKLQQENEFLRERENKLQLIEQLFKNEPVDLSELAKLVKGSGE